MMFSQQYIQSQKRRNRINLLLACSVSMLLCACEFLNSATELTFAEGNVSEIAQEMLYPQLDQLTTLQDEENPNGDHPKLWKNFAISVGADKNKIEKAKQESFTKRMIDNFFKQGRKSYAEGLASLYTYERQIPEIADTKIRGLKKYYGVRSKKGLEFFEAHKAADVLHRKACEKLLDGLSKKEQKRAEKAALSTAKFLWNFLSGMVNKHSLRLAA